MTKTTRPTLASTNARIDEMMGLLSQVVGKISTPEHLTATAVAEKVESAPAPAVKAATTPNASDELKAFAESKGLKFAKGGRVELGLDEMRALTRVLKTGKPEVITVGKRIIAVGRTDDGTRAFTQNLYNPAAK